MNTESRISIILRESAEGKALVEMSDGDKFFVTYSKAAQACKAVDQDEKFGAQFEELLERLVSWIEPRKEQIASARLTIKEDGLLFLVMQNRVLYNPELSEELTDLDIEVANDEKFSMLRFDVLLIPTVSEKSAAAFVASGKSYVYAK